MTNIASFARQIDYGKLAHELNKTGLSVAIKNNTPLPNILVKISEISSAVLPLMVFPSMVFGAAAIAVEAYKEYQASKNKDKTYPNATKDDIKQAHKILQKSKEKLSKDTDFIIAGRQNVTDTLTAWRSTMLSFINMKADAIPLDKKMAKSNFMFYGPTGTGKTYACRQIAKKAGFELRQLPSATHIRGNMVTALFSNESDNYRKYFNDLLEARKKGQNIALLIDEADQYISHTDDHNFNAFIEALEDHCIPVMFTSNNPAKFEIRTTRRALNFDRVDYNNIDVNESYEYTDKKGDVQTYNGMNCAIDIVKDIFKNAELDTNHITHNNFQKIVHACCDTKSRYLKTKGSNKYEYPYGQNDSYTTKHGHIVKRSDNYKPLSMTGVNNFAKLLLQRGNSSDNINEIIEKIAPEWMNTTDAPVNPDVSSRVGNYR